MGGTHDGCVAESKSEEPTQGLWWCVREEDSRDSARAVIFFAHDPMTLPKPSIILLQNS